LGARYVVISTNVPLRRDGLPYADAERVTDPGVAVYFDLDGTQHVIACDVWQSARSNTQAIAKTVEAMRGIERWGSSEIMKRAFSAFVALPPASTDWRSIFGADCTDLGELRTRYRSLAISAHPDRGGSHDEMVRLNTALEAAERELGAP